MHLTRRCVSTQLPQSTALERRGQRERVRAEPLHPPHAGDEAAELGEDRDARDREIGSSTLRMGTATRGR